MAEVEAKHRAKRNDLLLGWAVVAIATLIIGGIIWKASEKSLGSGGSGGSASAAESACRSAVTDELRSPGTAKFSNEQATSEGDSWTVVGTVDSENGFGALLRSDYGCNLTYDGTSFTVDHVDGIDGGTGIGFGN
jgi:hypothetical protein